MPPVAALALLAGLVAASALVGVLLTSRRARVRAGSAERVDAAALGLDAPLGDRATLVQFSTRYCTACPATARLLAGVAAERPGVVHREVDLTERPDIADRFRVLQTPTTLVLDGGDRVRARIGGAPDRIAVTRELDLVLGGPR